MARIRVPPERDRRNSKNIVGAGKIPRPELAMNETSRGPKGSGSSRITRGPIRSAGHHQHGSGGNSLDTYRERRRFLNQFVRVVEGHWRGYHLETFPKVGKVVFNEDRTQATVHFRLGWRGGRAVVERTQGSWRFKEYGGLTWIE
jgi:hypothetical protein